MASSAHDDSANNVHEPYPAGPVQEVVPVSHNTNEPHHEQTNATTTSVTIINNSLAGIPKQLHSVMQHIRDLQPDDLVEVARLANERTVRLVFGLLANSPWYVPDIRVVRDDEPQWGWKPEPQRLAVVVTAFGREVRLNFAWWTFLASALVLMWYVLYNIIGSDLMTKGGYVWDPLVLFVVSAIVGGTICSLFQSPPLLGMLWMGIMWNNIPEVGFLTSGIYKDVTRIVQRCGLVLVLARAGFALSVRAIRPHALETILLATVPYGVETTVHALMANALFGFESYTWAFLQGCMCSIVSPAIIVAEIIKLQDAGIGKGIGPLSVMISAVGLEVCYGVWATSFILDLLFSSGSLAKLIVMGPVQLIGGSILGMVVGWCFVRVVGVLKEGGSRTATGEPHPAHVKRVMTISFGVFLMLCAGFVFFGYNHNLAGGGSVMTVAFAAMISHMWQPNTSPQERMHYATGLSVAWESVVMPILFSIVGSTIKVKDIFNESFTPKMIGILAAATGARMLLIFLSQMRAPYDWKQKLIACGGYAGKATAQASMAPLALLAVQGMIATEGLTGELPHQLENAKIVARAAQFYIIVTVPICTVTISKLGSRFLPRVATHSS